MSELHNYEHRLQSTLDRIANDPKLCATDKQLIADYVEHCKAQGLSAGRRFKLAWTIRSIAKQMPCTFKEAGRKEIEKVVAWINTAEKYTPNTKSDLKKVLKHFYRFVRFGNVDKTNPYPPEVSWIPTVIKRNELKQEEIITESEAKRMIEVAPSPRDKAIISVAYEGGFRIGELLAMKVGSVTFVEYGCRVQVEHGKTGPREPLLVASSPVLATYLDSHPFKNEPEAPLWIGIEGPNKDRALGYAASSAIFKKTARLAGIKKRIHPHLFRTSSATRDAEHGITDRFLEAKYGWTNGSKMAAYYSRGFEGKALDSKLLEVYAGKDASKVEPTFRPSVCQRCKAEATPGQQYCARCGNPLDAKLVIKSEEELASLRQSVELLTGNVNFLMDEVSRRDDEESRLKEQEWKDNWMRRHPSKTLTRKEVEAVVKRSESDASER